MTETRSLHYRGWIVMGFRTLEYSDLGFVSDFVFRISSLPTDIERRIYSVCGFGFIRYGRMRP